MNILLISQCDKRALTETRRILDQFAERRGDRTWQTPMTKDGLDTLRRLLRKTARKNTAVACHWIRGLDHSELLWVVGDAGRFNAQGAVPTNTTARNVLRRDSENDWHSLDLIYLVTALAALLHDLGKACQAFQSMLIATGPRSKNLYRHEWISLRLFQAFVGKDSDAQWLQRLMAPTQGDDQSWLAESHLLRDGLDSLAANNKPLAAMPPLARLVGWLVLTHHRLPVIPVPDRTNGGYKRQGTRVPDFQSELLHNLPARIDAHWNEPCDTTDRAAIEPYWDFPHGLPVTTTPWRKRAASLAKRLLAFADQPAASDWQNDPYIAHIARLGLMLADHHYSSLQDDTAPERKPLLNPSYPLWANTRRGTSQQSILCQTLDEHLLGVERQAGLAIHALPNIERHLPRLHHKGLKKRSDCERFRWQDKAADLAASLRERADSRGAFLVNMASTGCGKTLANARIMHALSNPQQGMRCAFAMGLRTLTLQTGRAFRDMLNLSGDELAIKVGGAASRALFNLYAEQAEQQGSASRQDLLPKDGRVLFEGNDQHPLLQRLSADPQVRSLLAAPMLVCTVDHLIPATESLRGGHQIAPMLRLMSSDLVLDEIDDFDIDDLPALTRLVHWAGLLGSRVLLSSATLPPALVEGLFLAYLEGRRAFQRHRGERARLEPAIVCAWFDEFGTAAHDCADATAYRIAHLQFAQARHTRLGQETVRRRAQLIDAPFSGLERGERRGQFAHQVRGAAWHLHQQHRSVDPHSGKRVSFGLVRMANIDPLFDVALALYAQDALKNTRIHLCVYHSQFPLLMRSAIEYRLDTALDRRKEFAVFDLPDIRQRLDAHGEQDQLFIVLASPVSEVGRDHCYDWAVVEPSSMRSLIQLAGRIRRHRPAPVEKPNLLIFNHNLRHFDHPGQAAFCKPGFENDHDFRLMHHDLQRLLAPEEQNVIDARPRILPRTDVPLAPRERLVDLEHARLAARMLPQAITPSAPAAPLSAVTSWLSPDAHLSGVLVQQQPFRYDPLLRLDLVLLPKEDEKDYELHRVVKGDRRGEPDYVQVDGSQNHRVPPTAVQGERIAPWGEVDFMAALREHAEALDLSLYECARRFAVVSLPDATQGWRFHPLLGFSKER